MNPQGPSDPNTSGQTPLTPPYGQTGASPGYPTPPGVDPRTGYPYPPGYGPYPAQNPPQYGYPPHQSYGGPPLPPKRTPPAVYIIVGIFVLLCLLPGFIVAIGKFTAVIGGHQTLAQARAGYVTHLTVYNRDNDPLPNPPAGFHIVRYPAPLGQFPAIIADPDGGSTREPNGKHPVLIWVFGGFSNSIDDTAWAPATPDNDQSASAFRHAGIMTIYPSRRGGNGNAGYVETCYGEVDDVIAAAKYAASLPDVDPHRIYLAGHSTGGTVALLAAESTGMFRAVFCFGPIDDTANYGEDQVTYNVNDDKERELRAPINWLSSVQSPTFVIEGDGGNIDSLRAMRDKSPNPNLHFTEVPGRDHFSELSVTTPVIARKIAADTGPTCNISVEEFDWPQ